MSISLNGFGTDQNGNAGRLDPRLAPFWHPDSIKDAIEQRKAVLMGKRRLRFLAQTQTQTPDSYPDAYVGNDEFQVSIFVLVHHPPGIALGPNEHLAFKFVTAGVESSVAPGKSRCSRKGNSVGRQPQPGRSASGCSWMLMGVPGWAWTRDS